MKAARTFLPFKLGKEGNFQRKKTFKLGKVTFKLGKEGNFQT